MISCIQSAYLWTPKLTTVQHAFVKVAGVADVVWEIFGAENMCMSFFFFLGCGSDEFVFFIRHCHETFLGMLTGNARCEGMHTIVTQHGSVIEQYTYYNALPAAQSARCELFFAAHLNTLYSTVLLLRKKKNCFTLLEQQTNSTWNLFMKNHLTFTWKKNIKEMSLDNAVLRNF